LIPRDARAGDDTDLTKKNSSVESRIDCPRAPSDFLNLEQLSGIIVITGNRGGPRYEPMETSLVRLVFFKGITPSTSGHPTVTSRPAVGDYTADVIKPVATVADQPADQVQAES
jgi:hypothetical protein